MRTVTQRRGSIRGRPLKAQIVINHEGRDVLARLFSTWLGGVTVKLEDGTGRILGLPNSEPWALPTALRSAPPVGGYIPTAEPLRAIQAPRDVPIIICHAGEWRLMTLLGATRPGAVSAMAHAGRSGLRTWVKASAPCRLAVRPHPEEPVLRGRVAPDRVLPERPMPKGRGDLPWSSGAVEPRPEPTPLPDGLPTWLTWRYLPPGELKPITLAARDKATALAWHMQHRGEPLVLRELRPMKAPTPYDGAGVYVFPKPEPRRRKSWGRDAQVIHRYPAKQEPSNVTP